MNAPAEGNEAAHRLVASIRRADIRFLAPGPVRTAAVLGALPAWREALVHAGVSLKDSGAPDLVVAEAVRSDEAVRMGAEVVVLTGARASARLRAAGYAVHRYLLRPSLEDPTLVLALDHPAATRYAVTRATGTGRGWKGIRNAAAARLLARGPVPGSLHPLAIGSKLPEPPLLLRAAPDLGVPAGSEWYLTLGRGDQLSRNVFHLLEPGSPEPSWVLKFVRVRGYRDPFERDERGLELAASEPATAPHAPRLLGRLEVDGFPGSVETSASGELLSRVLDRRGGQGLDQIERIAQWIVELGRATQTRAGALEPEILRLAHEVVPEWSELGAGQELVEALPPVPAVLQHNDLGCWNIVVGKGSFTALDWESARRHGLPLWDLTYFLTDALVRLEQVEPAGWDQFVLSLYRGESRRSPFLFSWIRRVVEATGVPPDAVGAVVVLGWLHHGLSHVTRSEALAREEALGYPSPPPIGRLARLWLTEPGLGPGWRRWQDV